MRRNKKVTKLIRRLIELDRYTDGNYYYSDAISYGYPFSYSFDEMVLEISTVLEELIEGPIGTIEVGKGTKYGHVRIIAEIAKALGGILRNTRLTNDCNQLLYDNNIAYMRKSNNRTTVLDMYVGILDWLMEQVKRYGTKQQKQAYLNKAYWEIPGVTK